MLASRSVPYFANLPRNILNEIAFCLQELPYQYESHIKNGKEFPGIIFVYEGILNVEI